MSFIMNLFKFFACFITISVVNSEVNQQQDPENGFLNEIVMQETLGADPENELEFIPDDHVLEKHGLPQHLWGKSSSSRLKTRQNHGSISLVDPHDPKGPHFVHWATPPPPVGLGPVGVGTVFATANPDPDSTDDPISKGPDGRRQGSDGNHLPTYMIRASSLYAGCGKPGLRSCFAYPDKCILDTEGDRGTENGGRCRVAAAFTDFDSVNPNWMRITLAATAPMGFVAIGFSKDRFMGDDLVVYCVNVRGGPSMSLFLSYNEGYDNIMLRDKKHFKAALRPIKGYAQSNGVITCQFDIASFVLLDLDTFSSSKQTELDYVNLEKDTGVKDFNLNQSYYIFLAFGRYYDQTPIRDKDFGTLAFHHMAVVSDKQVNLMELRKNPEIIHPRGRTWILIHIILTTLAFSFFHPCAMFMAHYGREAYGRVKPDAKTPTWLLIHISFNVIGVILSAIGFIGILVELEMTWRSVTGITIFHSVFGIFAIVASWINVAIGLIGLGVEGRYKGDDKDRRYNFKRWMHWNLGQCIYISGMGCLYIAPYARRAYAPCVFQYVAFLQIFIHFATHLFMKFHTYYMVHKLDGRYLGRRTLPGPMIPWIQEDMKEWTHVKHFDKMHLWCGRRRAVIFYFITSALCCIGMIVLMFVPTVLCRQVK